MDLGHSSLATNLKGSIAVASRGNAQREHCFSSSPESAGASWMKCIILCLSFFACLMTGVNARDLGQWGGSHPGVRQWYQALMQPYVPNASCCDEADAHSAVECTAGGCDHNS